MASVSRDGNRWRACIRNKIQGNLSRCFGSEQEALDWIEKTELPASTPLTAEEEMMALEVVTFSKPAAPLVGVYFLIRDGQIVYIGQSANIHRRLIKHAEEGKQFDRYYVLPCTPEELPVIERRWINAFKPEYNRDVATVRQQRRGVTKK